MANLAEMETSRWSLAVIELHYGYSMFQYKIMCGNEKCTFTYREDRLVHGKITNNEHLSICIKQPESPKPVKPQVSLYTVFYIYSDACKANPFLSHKVDFSNATP